ncbi:MAG: hypothetical protein ABIO70_32480 [Pseudomonadota bacterium]
MNRTASTSVLLLLAPLTACVISGPNSGPDGDCQDNSQCDVMQACLEGACEDVQCLVSADCPLHSFCTVEAQTYTCREGCSSNDDCMAGENCDSDSHSCVAYGCRSTELDCPVGSTCNTATGQCTDVAGLCTTSCDVGSMSDTCGGSASCQVGETAGECTRDRDCDTGYLCDMFQVTSEECYTNQDCSIGTCYGAIPGFLAGACVQNLCHVDFCMPDCNTSQPNCPAGFSCESLGVGTQGVCWGACQWFLDNGYL